jgi:uncharacterized protein YebE (UPF0316 family)
MEWWLPVLIFLAETLVVTLGTVRTIFVARGMKRLAACLGLVEATIWLFAISQVVTNLAHLPCSVAYALGFTCGNYLGVSIEEKLAIGTQVVRIITPRKTEQLIERLNAADFGVTCVDGNGATGPVKVIFTIIKRHQLDEVVAVLRQHDPHLFYTVEDVRNVKRGVFKRRRDPKGAAKVPYRLRLNQGAAQAQTASSPPFKGGERGEVSLVAED